MKNFDSFVENCLNTRNCGMASTDMLQNLPFNVALPPRPWEVDCIIRVPEHAPVMLQYFDEDHIRSAAFVPCEVTFPDGMTLIDRLFLGTLTKAVRGTDADGKSVYDYAKGTVNQAVRASSGWAKVLPYLTQNTIKVTAVRTHDMAHGARATVFDLDFA